MEAFAVASIRCIVFVIEVAFVILNLYLILILIVIKKAPEWIRAHSDSFQSGLTLLFILDIAIWIVLILNWTSAIRLGGAQ